jgi:hypothetical protein
MIERERQEGEMFLSVQMNTSRGEGGRERGRERETEKSQAGIKVRERELIIGRKRKLIFCCYCCTRMLLLSKIKKN